MNVFGRAHLVIYLSIKLQDIYRIEKHERKTHYHL